VNSFGCLAHRPPKQPTTQPEGPDGGLAVVADPLACVGAPSQRTRLNLLARRCAPVSVIYSARWMKTRFQGAELETALLYEEEGGGAEPEGGSSQASSSEDSLIAHWRTSRFSGA